jgi:hypothetical protein
MKIRLLLLVTGAAALSPVATALEPQAPPDASAAPAIGAALFQTSHECLACHNGLTSPAGEDVSIGAAWRGSMMANASRDPYWQAAVRREALDHPSAVAAIEDECSVCHMPMARTAAVQARSKGRIFAHLPVATGAAGLAGLAADGASCTACHQIRPDGLGTPRSFTGGYVIAPAGPGASREAFGAREVEKGLAAVMRSATGFRPAVAPHVRQSELCATCHTLITHALGPGGETVGTLPEQVPYLEWRHSAYAGEKSCQACHMPPVEGRTPVASVLGEPRDGLARHGFAGGNAFMIRMLNRYRAETGVEATPRELEVAASATLRQLDTQTATVSVAGALDANTLAIDVAVANLTGHKLPTGYPSRRAWLHLVVRDAAGRAVFESGAVAPSGAIAGNDGDADAGGFEPHHAEIARTDDVQVYEAVMVDSAGALTTGLLSGVRYVKDNRLLPRGFDKATAPPEVRVHGEAGADADFDGAGDRVRYRVDVGAAPGPFRVEARLLYQPISYRWARNLEPYEAPETRRFVGFYDSMPGAATAVLASTATVVR